MVLLETFDVIEKYGSVTVAEDPTITNLRTNDFMQIIADFSPLAAIGNQLAQSDIQLAVGRFRHRSKFDINALTDTSGIAEVRNSSLEYFSFVHDYNYILAARKGADGATQHGKAFEIAKIDFTVNDSKIWGCDLHIANNIDLPKILEDRLEEFKNHYKLQ